MDIDQIINKAREIAWDVGNHQADSGKACIMEAVAWAAGETWSDFPVCVSRDIARLCQTIHDSASSEDYASIWTDERLRAVLGAAHGIDVSRRRAYWAAHYAAQRAADQMQKAKLPEWALRLRAVAVPTTRDEAVALYSLCLEARTAAAAYAAAAYAAAAAHYAHYARSAQWQESRAQHLQVLKNKLISLVIQHSDIQYAVELNNQYELMSLHEVLALKS